MQIVRAIENATVYDQSGDLAYNLESGKDYVLYDHEAVLGRQQGAIELLEGLDRRLRFYKGEVLTSERLLLPFIGRLGDLFVTISCLQALLNKFPDAIVDIACNDKMLEALHLLPPVGQARSYPLPASSLKKYDYYMTFEDVDSQPRGAARSYTDIFSACLHTPRPKLPAPITIPTSSRNNWQLADTSKSKVAVVVSKPSSLRTYPVSLVGQLAGELLQEGLDVYLIGQVDENHIDQLGNHIWKNKVGQLSAVATNLVNQTPTVADLAAVISQMDVVVTGDSLPLHLAGSLGIPTIALFTATNRIIASDYPSAQGLQSDATCSPCAVADGPCPLNHDRCIAHNSDTLAPNLITSLVRSLIKTHASVAGRVFV